MSYENTEPQTVSSTSQMQKQETSKENVQRFGKCGAQIHYYTESEMNLIKQAVKRVREYYNV